MSWFQKYTPSFSKAGSAIKSAGAWDVGDAAYSAAKTTTDYAARSITGTARLFSAIGVGAYQAASKPVGDGGLLIFFVSLLIYLFEMFYVPLTSFGEFYALKLPLSIALFIIAIVLVQRKSGIVLGGMVIFWYFYDGSFISFSSVSLPEFIINLLKFLAPYVISYALLMILFSFIGRLGKAQNTGVVELVANDIGGFLVPFIILLLDIGFASYIGTAFNLDVLSTVVESLFLNIPIWAMYGLIKSESESPIIHLLRNASVLYVVAILIMGIIPLLPQVTGTPNVSDPSELIKAQQEKRAQLPEHILISQLLCIGTTQYGSIPECVKQRQAESKCKD
ncbi:MAG TPA: hypothetical protein VJB66_00715, partial [Candidatus Nanoarchaeia archaeon]|nr:hypothetical protein [Candidatus Nanoarchaeia archaeon]